MTNITRIKTSIAPSSSAGQCSSFWWYFHQIFCLMSLYLVNFQIKIYNWTGPDWCIFSRGSDSRITFVCPFVHYREILWQVNMTKFMHLFHSFKCRFLKSLHLWLLSIKLDNLIFDIHEFIKNNNGLWNKILNFFLRHQINQNIWNTFGNIWTISYSNPFKALQMTNSSNMKRLLMLWMCQGRLDQPLLFIIKTLASHLQLLM